jgi:hypothetical protein
MRSGVAASIIDTIGFWSVVMGARRSAEQIRIFATHLIRAGSVPGSVRFCRFGTAATALAEGFVKLRLVGRIPTFIVAPNPHPDDRPFLKGARENWWPENHELTILERDEFRLNRFGIPESAFF